MYVSGKNKKTKNKKKSDVSLVPTAQERQRTLRMGASKMAAA
jgi:hypothetical protein